MLFSNIQNKIWYKLKSFWWHFFAQKQPDE